MNLNRGYNDQKLQEILEGLKLSEELRQEAELFLDPTMPDDGSFLSKLSLQDLSETDKDLRQKSAAYVEHLRKRGRTDELSHYIKFLAALGGSTAGYLIATYGWNLNRQVSDILTEEQILAIKAEMMVWNTYCLRENSLRSLYETGKRNPSLFVRAMELCCNKDDNAKVLLAACYLRNVYPVKQQAGLLKGLFGKEDETAKQVQKVVKDLEDNIIASIPNMCKQNKFSSAQQKVLEEFVCTAGKDGAFTREVADALKGLAFSDYLITLLSGCAFLAIEHSPRFWAFVRLALAMNMKTALESCLMIDGFMRFDKYIPQLEKDLPPGAYIRWCLDKKRGVALRRMAAAAPDAVRSVAKNAGTDDYAYLMEQVAVGNPTLHKQMHGSMAGEFRMKMAEELSQRYQSGKTEVKQYLLGEGTLAALYPFVKEWRSGWNYDYNRGKKIHGLSKSEEQQMYRRAVVMEGLCMRSQYFTCFKVVNAHTREIEYGYSKNMGREEIKEVLRIFDEEQLPMEYQLEALSGVYDGYYSEESKKNLLKEAVAVLAQRGKEGVAPLSAIAKDGIATARMMCIRVLDVYSSEYKDALLSCAMDSSKQVREVLCDVYAVHKDWEADIRKMLSSKKSQERELAILVMKRWGADTYREEFSKALEVEKSKKLKELLNGCLGIVTESTEAAPAGPQSVEGLAAQILKGGKKRKVAWAYETPFIEVHKVDGTVAEEDYLQAILVAYADMNIPGVSPEAAQLAAQLKADELAAYVKLLFDKWLSAGAEAKKKWVLYAASIHGGEDMVSALYHQIQEWPKNSRGAMAAEAVKAMALSGSPSALMKVDQIARKFKFRQVKTAASDALTYAAEQLHISRAELEDRIVPNLGFDESMERTFDYGPRTFRVLLSPALELEVFDEAGKKLKSLPAPGKRDEEEKAKAASDEFKQLKKQLKTVVTSQKQRLEEALSAERLWQVDKWKELFVKNPVMHQFAMGLIWGMYLPTEDSVASGQEAEAAGNAAKECVYQLQDTFRYMEDGSFNTVDEDEYEFPETGAIGLVHPIELSEETRAAWEEQLSDYEVTQPIEQLKRQVFRATEEEKQQKELTRFGGKLLNGLSLSGKLQGQGWYRGSVLDAGGYYTFYREDGKVGVELEFSGLFVGDENEEITVYGARFYRPGTVRRGSYVYDAIKDENNYTLGEISPRYFSEIVLQLTRATVSSQEQLPYPACKERQ